MGGKRRYADAEQADRGEGARAGQGDSAKGGKRRMGLATTWGVLTYYFLYYTHTTCSLTKRYPFVNLFSCVSARSAKNTFPRIKSVLRLRCWWGPPVGRWLAAFSESDGLTFDRRPALVCVTSIEGRPPARCLPEYSKCDGHFPPTLSTHPPSHSLPAPPDCLITHPRIDLDSGQGNILTEFRY